MINRYSRPEMANIWSEENKYRAWHGLSWGKSLRKMWL